MANDNKPFGLKPVRHLNGAPWNGMITKYCILAATNLTYGIYVGDPVIRLSTATAEGIPHVTEATIGATNRITGIVVGFEPDPTNLATNYRATGTASADRNVYVCDDPDVIFAIQDDGGGGSLAVASIVGMNAVLSRDVTGANNGYTSGITLDSGSATAPANDATYQLLVRRASPVVGNTAGLAHCIWEVLINLHTERSSAIAGI